MQEGMPDLIRCLIVLLKPGMDSAERKMKLGKEGR
jgi:hypothetical protein